MTKKNMISNLGPPARMTSYNFIIYFINRYWYWYFKPHNQQLKLHSNDHENAFIVVTMIRNWFAIKWEEAKTYHIDFSSFINAKFINVSFAQRYSRRSEKNIYAMNFDQSKLYGKWWIFDCIHWHLFLNTCKNANTMQRHVQMQMLLTWLDSTIPSVSQPFHSFNIQM